MRIGFIGLGNLGTAIAKRLSECGHDLTVYNRTKSKAHEIAGVKVAASPMAVKEDTGLIFMCLFDSNAVSHVLNQESGLLEGGLAGKIVVDLTTNHFEPVLHFHKVCSEAGGSYLEAPVLGSVVPASKGELTVLVSGDKKAYDTVHPVLAEIGRHIFHFSIPGLATKMKLVNNLVLGSFMATLSEALSLGEEVGLDRTTVLDILSVGAGNSLVLNAKKEKLKKGDFSTHFSNALIYKDLHCVEDLAYALKKPVFVGSLVKQLYARTIDDGMETEDFSSIYKVFKGEERD